MKIDIPDDFFDGFLVSALKDGLDTVRKTGWVRHSDDIVNNVKVEAAFVTLLEYYMTCSDFKNFIRSTYNGSDADSGE